jgi:hypothetical protein
MNAETALTMEWGPYEGAIRECMVRLAEAPMPEQADFLWFVLMPNDLIGMPVIVWPTERNQQQHDGWEHQNQLMQCVPDTVELPNLADSPERVDRLRDACAAFLMRQWRAIDPFPMRLAYFSINDDGWYISLCDGRRIPVWDIENEISEQADTSNGG